MAWWIYALAAIAITSLGLLFVLLVALRVSVRYTLEEPGDMSQPGFVHTLVGLTSSPERPVTQARLYGDVDEIYESMLEAIRGAQHTITFETYLFWSGQITDRFVEAFGERARAGVKVKLLLDADGSRFLTRRTLQALKDSWHSLLGGVRVKTPDAEFDSMVNVWNAYNSLITIAEAAGFQATLSALQENLREEEAMAEWLRANLRSVTLRYASLKEIGENPKT